MKEMVHRIFKSIVPRTNLKNVGLDLLKHYTTLFTIRHLLDGGIDLRFSTSNNGFMNLSRHLKRLMSDWFITKDIVDIKDDESEGIIFNIFYLINVLLHLFNTNVIYLTLPSYLSKVYSPDERISNILLKKHILRKNIETSLLLNIQAELKLAYQDLGDNSAIFNSAMSFFGYASFLLKKKTVILFYAVYILGMLYQSISKMEKILRSSEQYYVIKRMTFD